MKALKKLLPRESGIALLTTMLLMLLMSSLMVGFIILITSGQKLSGYNNDYSRAFYGAEAAMEKMTADIGTLFDNNYAPSGTQINTLEATPPVISGVNYLQANGTNGYIISFPTDSNGNPLATTNVISSGAYQGMTALQTTYTLNVTARTTLGSEVKLQRTTQTVGIPIFQFGIFSQTDLSFFPGPNFNFGGRTATNGNLFLASGSTLTLSSPVTAVGQVVRTNLANGYPTQTGTYPGSVNIFNGSGTRPLAYSEGSLVGTLGTAANSNWPTISLGPSYYAGNLRNGETGANALNLGIVMLGNGTTQPIDLLRRPVNTSENTQVTALRYYAQASLKILLSDDPRDIMSLPCIDGSTQPFRLSDLAMPVASWSTVPATSLEAAMIANDNAGYNTPPVPLAASGATVGATAYSVSGGAAPTGNGYWLTTPSGGAPYGTGSGLPIITGYIKIEVQQSYGSPCGSWKDVTQEVLAYGYAGRNINPNPTGATLAATQYGSSEPLLKLQSVPANSSTLFASQVPANTPCPDVHPNAIIRLERVRDNPSNYVSTRPCGILNSTTTPPTTAIQVAPGALVGGTTEAGYPADYWPNVLFDTREGLMRDVQPTGSLGGVNYSQMITPAGVMQYIELDAKNVAAYLAGTGVYTGKSGHLSYDSVNAPNDYTVYISDRRGNYTAAPLTNAWPPLSPMGHETGEWGWDDIVNPASANGCPNGTQDTGEDLDQLGVTGFYTYGQNPTYVMDAGVAGIATSTWAANQVGGATGLNYGQYAFLSTAAPGNLLGATANNAWVANPNCTVTVPSAVWPMMQIVHANEARENPNPFFRRAVKVMDGSLLNLGTCPGGVPCGLAIASENPVYIQGDFNANSGGSGFSNTTNVAVSVNADAVTLLSNNFNDVNTFLFPNEYPYVGGTGIVRNATTTWYRMAIMAGKGISFPQPTGTNPDFGTDGGVHNFLRYIENWGGQTLNYRGSIISMYSNRQATGLYKCCTTVYSPPTRGYNFDTEFLTPSLLPPRTPLFRDVNTTGFTQLLLPTQ